MALSFTILNPPPPPPTPKTSSPPPHPHGIPTAGWMSSTRVYQKAEGAIRKLTSGGLGDLGSSKESSSAATWAAGGGKLGI